jgi:hypothetical protein
MLSRAILLGPQRHVPVVRPAVEALAGARPRGAIALVSAGWEEREAEDGEFRDHLQHEVVNLEVWGRVERIFEQDPELLAAMRQRHDTLRQAQELYRLRLSGLVAAAGALLRRSGDEALLEPERREAVQMLRDLDRSHVARVAAINGEFDARLHPSRRESVHWHRQEIAGILRAASCLCIAGGHVGVLLHRLRLFDVLGAHGDRPVVAWSAGAMVLGARIVLFHDHATGSGTEVMEAGFAAVRGIVPLPHARRRLRLDDPENVQLLARRFEPDACVLLDDGCRIEWDGHRWSADPGTSRLTAAGRLEGA